METKNTKIEEKYIYPCKYGKNQKVEVKQGFYKGYTGNIKDIEIKQGISQTQTIYLIRNEEANTEIWQPEDNIKRKKILGIL